jgi:DNA-binding IclR family transcriptional regulator
MKANETSSRGQSGGASPSNRSLLRGVEILRAFRPGADLLGNGDLSERTGISRATVSRLTQTLVACGMLEHDRKARAYRLAAPVLSLAHAMRSGSPVMRAAAPTMLKTAEKLRVNVGLAVADRDEMVYLESIRYNRKVSLRNVVAGQRVPIELTSLGRAYLAALPEDARKRLLDHIGKRRSPSWKAVEQEIAQAISSVHQKGYCFASWQPEVVAVASPIVVHGHPIYVVNMSVATTSPIKRVVAELSPALLALAKKLSELMAHL